MTEENISGITKIAVKGFKSIAEECEIDIRPLTILAGANSSGKSSMMQPLLMLKQTLEAPYDPGPLKIDGPNVEFTEAAQFLSKLDTEKRTDRLQVKIETGVPDLSTSVGTTFRKRKNGFEIVKMTRKANFEIDHPSFPQNLILYTGMPPEEIKSLADQDLSFSDLDVVRRSRCFLYLGSKNSNKFYEATSGFEQYIIGTIHIPGLRGIPERIYPLSSTESKYPGTFENYTASVIHKWQETTDERLKTVTNALHTLELTGKVATKKIGDVGIEVQVGRLPHTNTDETDMVNIADVGIGVSQVYRF